MASIMRVGIPRLGQVWPFGNSQQTLVQPQDDSDDEEWEEGFLEAHEELWPLKEALERAVMRKTEAIAQKEALEAKVGCLLTPPTLRICWPIPCTAPSASSLFEQR